MDFSSTAAGSGSHSVFLILLLLASGFGLLAKLGILHHAHAPQREEVQDSPAEPTTGIGAPVLEVSGRGLYDKVSGSFDMDMFKEAE